MFNKNKVFQYDFWFWENKFQAILEVLAYLADYDVSFDEVETIKYGLSNTNSDKNIWYDYFFQGKAHLIKFKLAKDEEEHNIISIQIETSIKLKEKLELIDFCQETFRS